MLNDSELAKVLASWKKECGEEKNSHFVVPGNRPGRLAMYKILINTLINKYEYTESDLEGKTERIVVDASVNPISGKKTEWKIIAARDWKDAVDDFFPKETLDFDPSTVPERKRKSFQQQEFATVDPRLEKDNPIDTTIFEGLPSPVSDEVDTEFLELLKGVKDE